MRLLSALFVLATLAGAGMPPASPLDKWFSKHNRKRLKLDWSLLPDTTPVKLPDGSTEPRRAPTPFMIYVVQNTDSKAHQKFADKLMNDTRFVLATRAVKLVKIKPSKAIDIEYLAAVRGIKDPTLILLDRDFKATATYNKPTDFNANKILKEIAKLSDEEYAIDLDDFIGDYMKLMKEGEKLWKEEEAIEKLATKAGEKDAAKQKKLDAEVTEREQALAVAMQDLEGRFARLEDKLVPKAEAKEAIPETVGSGKKKRKLTPQEIEAIETFREFARDDNPIVRAAAVEDLGAIDSAVMVDVILDAANDMDPRVVEAAGIALGRMSSEEALEAMVAGFSHSKAKAREAAVLAFSYITRPYPAAVPHIVKKLKGGNDNERRAAIKALENQKDVSAAPALIAALDDSEPALRVLAANALGALKSKQAVAPLLAKLDARDWSLQKAAAEALGSIRAKESIEPVLQKFENEDGLLKEVLYKTLVAITGQDFRYRTENWRKWWDKFGASFQVPTEKELAETAAKRAKAMEGYATTKRTYHKIETHSKKMIFIIDISASMKDKIVFPPDATDAQKAEYPDRERMEIAKKELIEFLGTLDRNVYFNILTFAGRVKPWRDGLVSASARTSAIKFVAKLKPLEAPRGGGRRGVGGGGSEEQKTNTYAALMEAFGLADQKVPDWKARSKVDTIFLVTDGQPTTGEIVEVPKLIRAITELNRTRGVVIHVITFDKITHRKLKELAEKNGGQAVLRGF